MALTLILGNLSREVLHLETASATGRECNLSTSEWTGDWWKSDVW